MKQFYILSAIFLCCAIISYSQPGSLDVSFGIGGKVNTNMLDINKGSEAINAVAIQPDGKIIVAGTTMSPGIILRYNTDGSPDNSFDTDGMFFAYGYKFDAVALQPDGKIVTAGNGFVMRLNSNGSRDNSFDGDGIASGIATGVSASIVLQSDGKIIVASSDIVARFNVNGSPDNSFDGDGQATVSFGPGDNSVRGAAIQADGKIVLSGSVYNGGSQFGVARFNTNGSPDNSFDSDGMVTTSFGSIDDYGYTVAIQTDGKIVVAGYSNFSAALARYTTGGSLDNSFDGDGKVIGATGAVNNYPASMALQADGKILTAVAGPNNFLLLRYNTNGTPDNSFDGDGIVSTDMGPLQDMPTCIAIQSNGRIVVGGFSLMNAARDFSMACYKDDGSLDNSFDGDGKLIGYFGTSYDIGRSIAIQNDGKIVVAGYTGIVDLGNNNDFALARYNTNGTLDNSFDGDGKVAMAISSSSDDQIRAVAIQSDGKIIAAGISRFSSSSYDIAVVRYNANGTLDNSFDGDGIRIINATAGNDLVTCIAIQNNGKILLGGFALLICLNPNGSLDNSFDGDGILNTSVDGINSIVVQNDGKILVAGYDLGDFAVARYNTNGSPDNSFDGDGFVSTDINATTDILSSIAIQPDGKIVAGGLSGTNFAVVRYNSNGSLDNSFDGDGKLTTDMGGSAFTKCVAVALQSNGKIILAGGTRNADDDFILARYNSNGSLDNSFDGDGKATLDLGPGSYEHVWDMKLYSNRIYMVGDGMTASAVDFILAAVVADPLAAPLPLQLRDFSGKKVNEDALLTWKTENESDMLEYIVERSADGRNYTDVGAIPAANRAGIHNYSFTDYNITALNVSVVYYRLRQKGIDGKFSYSRIIALPVDKNKNIVLFYPNPVINEANVAMTVTRQEQLLVRIIDNNGRIVKQMQWDVSAGSTSLSIDVKNLAAGMYYLEIKGESIDYTRQFVK